LASEGCGREYDPDDFSSSDTVNMALSAAHACLYGVAHSVIVALGCSPGLGFVHTGHERSFVYDIADLYKAEITIPIAFQTAVASTPDEIGSATRRAVRDAISNGKILERAAGDIRSLLQDSAREEGIAADIVHLWDEKSGYVKNAVSYGRELDNDAEGAFDSIREVLDEHELEGDYGYILEDEG
jgi:CRISPR-associated protein Cas1